MADQPNPDKPSKPRLRRRRRIVSRTKRCFACDAGTHHPGKAVKNCKCPCGSSGGE